MAQRCAKVGPLDELQREVVRAVDNAKVEHPSDVPVMQEGGKPRFAKEHLHEVFVANKRRQDPLQTNTLLEVTGPTSNREKRLGHPPNTEALAQLVVTKAFGGCSGHERTNVPRLTVRGALSATSGLSFLKTLPVTRCELR